MRIFWNRPGEPTSTSNRAAAPSSADALGERAHCARQPRHLLAEQSERLVDQVSGGA